MLGIFGIYENLERAAAAILDNIVDGDIEGMVAFRPLHLVGGAFQRFGPVQGLGQVMDATVT